MYKNKLLKISRTKNEFFKIQAREANFKKSSGTKTII